MKKFLLLITSFTFLIAANQSAMYVSGDINGWGADAMTFRDLGTDSWLVSLSSSSDRGSSGFKFRDSNANWDHNWGRGDAVSLSTYTTWYSAGDNGTFNETNTYYYSFSIQDVADGVTSYGFVQKTTNSPITISAVSDNSGSGTANTDVTVSITINTSKSTEENIYVRYSTDGWTSDNWSLASGSGTSYSATISTSGSGTVSYYVLTTTLTSTGSSDLDNHPDLATLNYDNNGGSNYSYGYDQSLPVELSTFMARSINRGVALSWTTDSEIENQGFIITRKTADSRWLDVASFLDVKALQGQGSTTKATTYNFIDTQVEEGVAYSYQLSDVDYQGHRTDHTDLIQEITYLIPEQQVKPAILALNGLYPNPFNPSTTLSYDLAEPADVQVSVYNLQGAQVWNYSQPQHPAGQNFTLTWNGRNLSGQILASGIYLVRIQAGEQTLNRKVTLLR